MATGGCAPDQGVGIDHASLKPPLQLGSQTGLRQLLQCYHVGTDEIRETLMQECDVIIECKVCRSLYRGLPNFLAHKKSYCPNRYAGTLVRFQDMHDKENESYVFGAQVFQDEEEDELQFDSKGRRHNAPSTEYSTIYSYFKNIQKVGENVAKVRSTGTVLNLDAMAGTSAAVTQSVSTFKNAANEPIRKRKAGIEENVSQEQNKMPRVEKGKSTLNGILAVQSREHVKSLKELFKRAKLIDGITNRCLACKTATCNTYKSLKMHMKKKHLKTRTFHKCPTCQRLYIADDLFIHHLLGEHGMSQPEAVATTSMPRVLKYVINNTEVYDIPKIPGLDGSDASPNGKEERANKEQEDEPEEEEEEEEEEGDHHGSPKRGSYMCPKSFWLTIMRCLGIYRPGPKPKRYQCPKHPAAKFQKYTAYKEHALTEHIQQIIKCPMCSIKFKKYNHVAKLGKHLKVDHKVSELSVWKLKGALRSNMLIDDDCDDREWRAVEVAQTTDGAQDEGVGEEEDEEEVGVELKRLQPRGTIEYSCLKCDKSYPDKGRLRTHMKMVHGFSSEDFKERLDEIEDRKFFKPFRETSRHRPRDMDGGITSTFNLEDYFCPLCHKGFPKLNQVTNHLTGSHNCTKEETAKYKPQIKAQYLKHRQQNLKTLMDMRGVRGRRRRIDVKDEEENDDEEENQEDEKEDGRKKRKQNSPVKTTQTANQNGQTNHPSFSCPKCNRTFAKQCGMVTHQKFCMGNINQQVDSVGNKSDSSSDDDENDNARPKSTPPKVPLSGVSSIIKSLLSAAKSDLKCSKCGKQFMNNAQRSSHESSCKGRDFDSESLGVSTDSDDASVKELRLPDGSSGDGSKGSVMYKVYKCPLCDVEDLELHQINHHLMNVHGWTSAKVAARRDILKRSVVFKTCQNPKAATKSRTSSEELDSPSKSLSNLVQSGSSPMKDVVVRSNHGLLTDFSCSLCPKTYPELWKLTYHWQMCHALDSATVARMKKEVQEDRRRHLTELRTAQRSTRRGTGDSSCSATSHSESCDKPTPSSRDGEKTAPEAESDSPASSVSSVKLIVL